MPKPSQYSLICSARYNSLSIPALLRTFSFLTLPIRDTPTKLLKKLYRKNIHFPSLSTSHTPCLCSVQRRWYNNLLHIYSYWPLSPILYCSGNFSALPKLYTPYSFCLPHPNQPRLLNKYQINMGFSHFHGIWITIFVPYLIDVVK